MAIKYSIFKIYLYKYFVIFNFLFTFYVSADCQKTIEQQSNLALETNLASDVELLPEDRLVAYFKNKIDLINQTLLINHQEFKKSKLKLVDFVDQSLLPIWSTTKTVKALMGNTIWQSLSVDEQKSLEKSFNDTLQRYVQEGFEHYDQQQIEFVSLNLNKNQTNGYLTIKLIPNLLPSFNIDFKVSLIDNKWYLYDALVQGASYISLKNDYYRDLFKNQKIAGVLSHMNQKNVGYLHSLSNP